MGANMFWVYRYVTFTRAKDANPADPTYVAPVRYLRPVYCVSHQWI